MSGKNANPTPTNLPKLDTEDPCSKCGADDWSLQWVPQQDDRDAEDILLGSIVDPREHIRVTCGVCDYIWAAAPLDQEG